MQFVIFLDIEFLWGFFLLNILIVDAHKKISIFSAGFADHLLWSIDYYRLCVAVQCRKWFRKTSVVDWRIFHSDFRNMRDRTCRCRYRRLLHLFWPNHYTISNSNWWIRHNDLCQPGILFMEKKGFLHWPYRSWTIAASWPCISSR